MKDRNKNRPGYKKTRVGWIPVDWECQRLRNLCKRTGQYGASAPAIPDSPNCPRYIRITDITEDGYLLDSNIVSIDPEDAEKYVLHPGDFLFARTGATVGKTYLHKNNDRKCAFAGYLIRFTPDETNLSGEFLKNYTKTERYRHWVETNLHAGAQPNINAEEFGALPLPLPPPQEQKKIAEILSAWDDSIYKTRKLIEAKERLKKALTQKFMPLEKSYDYYNKDKWKERSLKELVEPVSRPVSKPLTSYFSIGIRSHGKGTFQKIVKNPEKIMMDTLYQVEANDLIVNITFAWEGAIAVASEQDSGALVSHRFPTFRIKETEADIDFFRNLIQTQRFVWDLGLISPGGAGRNRVLNQKNFLEMKIMLPPPGKTKGSGQGSFGSKSRAAVAKRLSQRYKKTKTRSHAETADR